MDLAFRNEGYDAGIRSFDNALAIDPDGTSAWLGKGVVFQNPGCSKEAIDCYDQALVPDPANTWAWSLKVTAFRAMGRPAEASEVMQGGGICTRLSG